MSIDSTIDKLIRKHASWMHVKAMVSLFVAVLFLMSYFGSIGSDVSQYFSDKSAIIQLKSFRPITKRQQADGAYVEGVQTMLFSKNNPIAVYLIAPDSQYPVSGDLSVSNPNSNPRIKKWSEVDQDAVGLWLSPSLAMVHDITIGDEIQLGETSVPILGFIENHLWLDRGLSQLMPLVIASRAALNKSQLIGIGSRVDYFYYAHNRNDPNLRLADSDDVKVTEYNGLGSLSQTLAVSYDVIDILFKMIVVWLVLGLYAATQYHIQQMKYDQYVCFQLGITRNAWMKRVLVGLSLWLALNIALWFFVLYLATDFSDMNTMMLSTGLAYMIFLLPVCYAYDYSIMIKKYRYASTCVIIFVTCIFAYLWIFHDLMTVFVALFVTSLIALLLYCAMRLTIALFTRIFVILNSRSYGLVFAFIALCRVRYDQLSYAPIQILIAFVSFCIFVYTSLSIGVVSHLMERSNVGRANVFVVNITKKQLPSFNQMTGQSLKYYPMIKGRLTHINNQIIKIDNYDSWTQASALKRDLNLTYTQQLPPANTIVSGSFYEQGISIESRLAGHLNVKVGDTMTLDVYGSILKLPITSIRSVQWTELTPNFFMILPERDLAQFASTYLTSFYWNKTSNRPDLKSLVDAFPNLNLFFIDEILSQIDAFVRNMYASIIFLGLAVVLFALYIYLIIMFLRDHVRKVENNVMFYLGVSDKCIKRAWMLQHGLYSLSAIISGFLLAKAVSIVLMQYFFNISLAAFAIEDGIVLFSALVIVVCLTCLAPLVFFQRSVERHIV